MKTCVGTLVQEEVSLLTLRPSLLTSIYVTSESWLHTRKERHRLPGWKTRGPTQMAFNESWCDHSTGNSPWAFDFWSVRLPWSKATITFPFPASSGILTLPKGLVCTANSWHPRLEWRESALCWTALRQRSVVPTGGRCHLPVVLVGEEYNPTFKRPGGKHPRTCTGSLSSESQSFPSDMDLAKDRTR